MKVLIVTGTFDEKGGKASSIGAALAQEFGVGSRYTHSPFASVVVNGGSLKDLEEAFGLVGQAQLVIWMPNVSNDLEKYLPRIKDVNQKCLLVSSKRVVEKDYSEWDVVGRLLKTKSNLGIMITQHDGNYYFKLLDPLGNQWIDTDDIKDIAEAIIKRTAFLRRMTRISSVMVAKDSGAVSVP